MWHFVIENATVATLLALAVWLASRSIRRPAVIHALWLIVLLKLITPPLLLVPFATLSHGPQFQTSIADSSNGENSGFSTTDWHDSGKSENLPGPPQAALAPFDVVPGRDLFSWANASWGLGLLWIVGSIGWFYRRLQEATRFSERIADSWNAPAELQQRAHQIAGRFGLARAPQVRIVPAVISPMLWGVGSNTRLLFPAGLLARLDNKSADTLLAHEIAHYRRGDHFVRLVELLISGLFWWHPVVWWIRRELEATEEKCCDAWVVHQLATSPRCYAEALLATLDFLSSAPAPLPPAATGIGDVPLLRERLTEIMSGPPAPQIPAQGRVALVFTGLCAMLISPSWKFEPDAVPEIATRSSHRQTPPMPNRDEQTREADLAVRQTAAAVPGKAVVGAPGDSGPVITTADVCAASPDQRSTVVRRSGGQLVWRLPAGDEVDLTSLGISAVAFSPDGSLLATCGTDRLIRCWDVSTGSLVHELKGHKDAVQSLAFSPAGVMLASGSRDGEVVLWNLYHWRSLGRLTAQRLPVNGLAVSTDGRWIGMALGTETESEGRLLVFDLDSWQKQFETPTDRGLAAIVFRHGGDDLSAGDWSGRWSTWNVVTGERKGQPQFLPRGVGERIRFSSEPGVLAQIDLTCDPQVIHKLTDAGMDKELSNSPADPTSPATPSRAG